MPPKTITGRVIAFVKQPNPYGRTPAYRYQITVRDDRGVIWNGCPAAELGAATGRNLTGYTVEFMVREAYRRWQGGWAFKYPHKGKIIALPA